jgi:dTDP-4-dehydrorhamnose reductase
VTIIVLGAGGQVGQEIVEQAAHRELVGLERSQLDITDAQAVTAILERHDATLVINAAAWTAVDRAESEPGAAWAANSEGPAVLATACATARIPLLHLSTDYVFDGRATDAYREDSPIAPLGVYGQSKWAGEEAVRERLPDQHLILRVAWVFGAYGNNFVRTMLRLGGQRRELSIVADQRGAPTHAGAIAAALLSVADRYHAGDTVDWGTYHLTGSPVTTWHDFAMAIFDEAHTAGLLEQVPVVHPISTEQYPLPAPRPANSSLDCERIRERLGIQPSPWIDGLRQVFDTWKQST